jgi:hypothetical protein
VISYFNHYGSGKHFPFDSDAFGRALATVRTPPPPMTTPEHDPKKHEGPLPSDIPISPGNDGIQALRTLANSMEGQTPNQGNPIVLGEISIPDLIIRQR